jgi:hypothetical protein
MFLLLYAFSAGFQPCSVAAAVKLGLPGSAKLEEEFHRQRRAVMVDQRE